MPIVYRNSFWLYRPHRLAISRAPEECNAIRAEDETCHGRLTLAFSAEDWFGMPTEGTWLDTIHRRLRVHLHTCYARPTR